MPVTGTDNVEGAIHLVYEQAVVLGDAPIGQRNHSGQAGVAADGGSGRCGLKGRQQPYVILFQPKVNAYACTPGSRNWISNVRSPIVPLWRMS